MFKNARCAFLCKLVQTLNSVNMWVPKMVWWLMEWVCCRLWALYPPNMKFLYYPHVDPVEVAMALNLSHMPHWGRFVTFSMWLQGYLPQLTDRVRFYNTVLRRQPRFIPCIYGLYGRWVKATLWRNDDNVPRRGRNRIFSPPIPTPVHQRRWQELRRFACVQRLSENQARDALRKSLTFTLHRPPRRRFKMAPVMVVNIDQQWVADLVEIQRYWRQNRGVRYLLTVVDVLPKGVVLKRCRRTKAKNFTI